MKITLLALLAVPFTLIACSNANEAPVFSFEMIAYPKDPHSFDLLWGGYKLPKNLDGTDAVQSLLPGDVLAITAEKGCHISDVPYAQPDCSGKVTVKEVKYGSVIEVTFVNGVPHSTDPTVYFYAILMEEAILPDHETTIPYAGLEKGYACLSAKEPGKAMAIYVENPRP